MIFALAALAAPTREGAVARAHALATHAWTMEAPNQDGGCQRDTYRSAVALGDNVGLPYDWGGFSTIAAFDAEIDAGMGAGSHLADGVAGVGCTSGIDAPGLVSRAWSLDKHHGTAQLPSVTTKVEDFAELRAGDALDRPSGSPCGGGHVQLHAHQRLSGELVVYEASPAANKVRVRAEGLGAVADGCYEPLRRGVLGERPGEIAEIEGFPFSAARWGVGVRDLTDTWRCDGAPLREGPEALFHVATGDGGTLEARLSAEGEASVMLLGSPDAGGCRAWGESGVRAEIPAGEVWIAVDTAEDAGWILTATFTGSVSPKAEEPVVALGPPIAAEAEPRACGTVTLPFALLVAAATVGALARRG